MNHLKLYEDFNQEEEEDWIETLQFIRTTFYDKLELVKKQIVEFEDQIDGVFNKSKWTDKEGTNSLNQLQLGIASESSYESFFMPESDIIVNSQIITSERSAATNKAISDIIKANSGIERFSEKLNLIRNRKRKFSSTVYYPYYKFEGGFSVDKDVLQEIDRNTFRYERWCRKVLEDLFPGWKCSVQIRPQINSCHFWVHLVDKTNVIKESIDNIRYPITSRDDLQNVEDFLDDTFVELFDQWGFSNKEDSELRYSYFKHRLDQKVSLSMFIPLDRFDIHQRQKLLDKAIELSKKVELKYNGASISWDTVVDPITFDHYFRIIIWVTDTRIKSS